MDELISIIIPVYNKKNYLMKSLESCKLQTYKSIEIIMIDDGSIDGSGEICLSFADTDTRFKYYKQENHGASYTRNRGIELAKGEWIVFLDADDELSPDFCKKCIELSLQENVDVVFTASRDYYPDGKTKDVRISDRKAIKWEKDELEDLIILFLLGGYKDLSYNYTLDGPCCKILRKEILNDVYFPEHIDICEDTCFMAQVIMNSTYVYYTSQVLYHRNIDFNSLSYSKDYNKAFRIADYIIWLMDYLGNKIEANLLSRFVTRVYSLMLEEYLRFSEYTLKERKQLIDKAFDKTGVKYQNLKYMPMRNKYIYFLYMANANRLLRCITCAKKNIKRYIRSNKKEKHE